MHRHLGAWIVSWAALFWLWLLLAGEWNRTEWIAAASAATVAATIGEYARGRGNVRGRLPLEWVRRSWNVPLMVVFDFGIVVWALLLSVARRDVVRGAFHSREFPVGGADPVSAAVRAWVTVAASYSPNAYVVEMEPERELVLLHDLVPRRSSEEPA